MVPYRVRLEMDSNRPPERADGKNPFDWHEWKHDETSDWAAVACAFVRWLDDINKPQAYTVVVQQTNTKTPVVTVKVTPHYELVYSGEYDE